jgi:glucose-1-phosphate adenylyltransferase
MKIRAIILAGGEGARLGVLTAKRTKPAVPFAGKYRIIDFTLSNCVNSDIYDVYIIAQYRPQSLIEHIRAGGPWDLNRDFTGGVRIYTPYRGRRKSDWFLGTADAIQQNFSFIKRGDPEHILTLSGDHIYAMDYEPMVTFHLDHQADLTMATVQVPAAEAPRFGIVGINNDYRVSSFVEKPAKPQSNLVNMGVYLFKTNVLDHYLWEDHMRQDSAHDFGKDILPRMVAGGCRVFAFPFTGYWVDVGTINSYWQAHMDLLAQPPLLDLNNRSWIIHTRTEERPPAWIAKGAQISDSMLADGCIIESGAYVNKSILSPGVIVKSGAVVEESILLTDAVIETETVIRRAILDKRVCVGKQSIIGAKTTGLEVKLAMVGKNSTLPGKIIIEPGGSIGTDVIPADFVDLPDLIVKAGDYIQTRRLPNEI